MTDRKKTTKPEEIFDEITEITEITETNEITENQHSKRSELNLIRHTEIIDSLVIQNKAFQKELDEADEKINELETKLADNSIKISKNMFYTFLGLIIVLVWFLNTKIVSMIETMIETKHIMREYKNEIEKIKLYNEILEKKVKGENENV